MTETGDTGGATVPSNAGTVLMHADDRRIDHLHGSIGLKPIHS